MMKFTSTNLELSIQSLQLLFLKTKTCSPTRCIRCSIRKHTHSKFIKKASHESFYLFTLSWMSTMKDSSLSEPTHSQVQFVEVISSERKISIRFERETWRNQSFTYREATRWLDWNFSIQMWWVLKALKSNFYNSNIFLFEFVAANMGNTLEVFKKQNPIKDESSHEIHRLCELNTAGFVQNIEKLSGESTFIVGTDQGHLSIYDFGSTDIICKSDLPFAQDSPISGLSSHPTSPSM